MKRLSLQDYLDGFKNQDRTVLARAITLIESHNPDHQKLAQELLQKLLPETGKSKRIGISGTPGVGKSTFIEAFGTTTIPEALISLESKDTSNLSYVI